MFKYSNITSQREKLSNLFNIITVILSLIAGISLIVSGLGIMTIMFVSVSERTREIGLKKAIGAKNSSICIEFILESFTLSFLGGIIGITLGLLFCFIGAKIFDVVFTVNVSFIGIVMLVSLIQGCVFGFLPSLKAASMKPVDALRHD
jgi:putative ABC transport system permease protein